MVTPLFYSGICMQQYNSTNEPLNRSAVQLKINYNYNALIRSLSCFSSEGVLGSPKGTFVISESTSEADTLKLSVSTASDRVAQSRFRLDDQGRVTYLSVTEEEQLFDTFADFLAYVAKARNVTLSPQAWKAPSFHQLRDGILSSGDERADLTFRPSRSLLNAIVVSDTIDDEVRQHRFLILPSGNLISCLIDPAKNTVVSDSDAAILNELGVKDLSVLNCVSESTLAQEILVKDAAELGRRLDEICSNYQSKEATQCDSYIEGVRQSFRYTVTMNPETSSSVKRYNELVQLFVENYEKMKLGMVQGSEVAQILFEESMDKFIEDCCLPAFYGVPEQLLNARFPQEKREAALTL